MAANKNGGLFLPTPATCSHGENRIFLCKHRFQVLSGVAAAWTVIGQTDVWSHHNKDDHSHHHQSNQNYRVTTVSALTTATNTTQSTMANNACYDFNKLLEDTSAW